MTADQVFDLLQMIAAADHRTVGKPDVLLWQSAIGDLPFDDCVTAVGAHVRESTEWLKPAHVYQRVKAIRASRLEHATAVPAPAPDASPGEYRDYIRAATAQLASGWSLQRALPSGKPLPGDPPTAFTAGRQALAAKAGTGLTSQQLAALQLEESRAARQAAEQAGEGNPDAALA